jgi:hypothetical protein
MEEAGSSLLAMSAQAEELAIAARARHRRCAIHGASAHLREEVREVAAAAEHVRLRHREHRVPHHVRGARDVAVREDGDQSRRRLQLLLLLHAAIARVCRRLALLLLLLLLPAQGEVHHAD